MEEFKKNSVKKLERDWESRRDELLQAISQPRQQISHQSCIILFFLSHLCDLPLSFLLVRVSGLATPSTSARAPSVGAAGYAASPFSGYGSPLAAKRPLGGVIGVQGREMVGKVQGYAAVIVELNEHRFARLPYPLISSFQDAAKSIEETDLVHVFLQFSSLASVHLKLILIKPLN